jgi:hypothetical protein
MARKLVLLTASVSAALLAITITMATPALAQSEAQSGPATPSSNATPKGSTAPGALPDAPATGYLAHPISASLLFGYGINNAAPSGAPSVNLYGVGIGVRGGYDFPIKVYAGATFMYNFGGSNANVNIFGVEGGYDFDVWKIVIRPTLGLGFASTSLGGVGTGSTNFSLWPTVTGLYNITDQIFAGLDVRYTVVTGANLYGGGSPNALGIFLTGGYRF